MRKILFILLFLSSNLFALDPFRNGAIGTVSGYVHSTDATLTLIAGDGAKFPLTTDSDFGTGFNAEIWDFTTYSNEALAWQAGKVEIIRVTANASNVFSITRAQESTTAQDYIKVGHTIKIVATLTKKFITDISALTDTAVLIVSKSFASNEYVHKDQYKNFVIVSDGNAIAVNNQTQRFIVAAGGIGTTEIFTPYPAGVIKKLRVFTVGNAAITTDTIICRLNGVDTALKVAAHALVAGYTSVDYTNTVTTVDTSKISWRVSAGSNGGYAASSQSVSIEFFPK